MEKISTKWLAGFFDGDGSLFIDSKQQELGISISQLVPSILEDIKSTYGGSIVRENWICSMDRREEFLEDIIPYLRIKRQQANLSLQYLRFRGKVVSKRYNSYSKEFLDKRDQLTVLINGYNGNLLKKQEVSKDLLNASYCLIDYSEDLDKEWLAGFFDAEGTISFSIGKDIDLTTSISQSDFHILNYISKTYQGSITFYQKQYLCILDFNLESHKRLLEDIVPYLKLKKTQALLALEAFRIRSQRRGKTHSKENIDKLLTLATLCTGYNDSLAKKELVV